MLGFICGFVCGCAEFYLLTKLTQKIIFGELGMVKVAVCKCTLLLGTFLAAALLLREQLALVGIGIVIPLVLGAFIWFIKSGFGQKAPDR